MAEKKQNRIVTYKKSNKNVALNWMKYMLTSDKVPKLFKGRNFSGVDNYLVSFNIPICQYVGCGVFKVSKKKYTPSTKRHQYFTNLALMDLKQDNPQITVECVDEIEGRINV